MFNNFRLDCEARLIADLLRRGEAQGWSIQVDDGDGQWVIMSGAKDALEAILAVDEADIAFFAGTARIGWVRLVRGNDPWEVVNDYSSNPETEALIAEHQAVCEHYEVLYGD